MIIRFADDADKQYQKLSPALRKSCEKQWMFLVRDIRHPSLHAKKYDEATGLWQARINKYWRFYFFIHGSVYFIVSIRNHPK